MLATAHVASAALTQHLCRTPMQGLAAGVASHLVLDAVPHWGATSEANYERTAVVDGLIALVASAALIAAAPPHRRLILASTIAGAVLPDLDKPVRFFTGRDTFPRPLRRFLSVIQTESPTYVLSDLTMIAAGMAAGLKR